MASLHPPSPAAAARPPTPRATSGPGSRLEKLKAVARKPGEASFFFFDAHFQNEAVKVLPGEYYVDNEELLVMTTLGSCIAACLYDRQARVGGMNHFMLPEGAGDSGRYGSYAMELLINEMMKRGATRMTMEAKVFGGGAVIAGMNSLNVGERNTRFVMDFLAMERIPVVSKDVLEIYPRKVCFLPASGKAMVKRLAPTNAEALVQQDRAVAAPAGFLFQLALRGEQDAFVLLPLEVADQARGHLDGVRLDRHAVLLHEQHAVVRRHRDHDGRAAGVVAFRVFPAAALAQAQPAALVQGFHRRAGVRGQGLVVRIHQNVRCTE